MDTSYGINGPREAVLGIDPGITTGWAVIEDGEEKGSGNLSSDEVKPILDTLIRALHRDGCKMSVVVERMPASGGLSERARTLEQVRANIREVIDTYELPTTEIAPGEWKTSRVARTTPLKRGRYSSHQRDAIRMALYHVDKEARRSD